MTISSLGASSTLSALPPIAPAQTQIPRPQSEQSKPSKLDREVMAIQFFNFIDDIDKDEEFDAVSIFKRYSLFPILQAYSKVFPHNPTYQFLRLLVKTEFSSPNASKIVRSLLEHLISNQLFSICRYIFQTSNHGYLHQEKVRENCCDECLVLAARYGFFDIAKKMIALGNPTESDNWDTSMKKLSTKDKVSQRGYDRAIEEASENGHSNILQLLVQLNLRKMSGSYNSGMRLAAENGHKEIISIILESNQHGEEGLGYALNGAVWGGHVDIIDMMIEQGDKVGKFAYAGALQNAILTRRLDIARRLVDSNRISGFGYLYAMEGVIRRGDIKSVQFLLNVEHFPKGDHKDERHKEFSYCGYKAAIKNAIEFHRNDILELIMNAKPPLKSYVKGIELALKANRDDVLEVLGRYEYYAHLALQELAFTLDMISLKKLLSNPAFQRVIDRDSYKEFEEKVVQEFQAWIEK